MIIKERRIKHFLKKMKKNEDEWEHVEVKTGKSRQTKPQKEFQEEVEESGGKYTVQREEVK